MTCHSKQHSEANTRLFVFASEQLKCKASELEEVISADNVSFIVKDYYEFSKNDPHPDGLFMLATGQLVNYTDVWRGYKKSDKIYFFVCQKNSNSTK